MSSLFTHLRVFQYRRRARASAATALGALLASLSMSAGARADVPTLAGQWTATPLVVTWQLGDWGKACGPQPSGGGVAGGPVTITQNGGELTFSGAGRNFSTGECWEQHPGLSRISHSAAPRSYQNVCKTSAGDPRQAKLITTITATDSRISFDETGQYQFVIEQQNCTASVRRTRSYSLVLREGESSPAPKPSVATPPPKPASRAASDCQGTGLPERLEVRPSRKLMRPGESFTFRTAVVDSKGCSLPVTPTWTVLHGVGSLSVTGPGSIAVSPTAPESEVTLEVTLGDRSVRVLVEIAAKDRYDAMLESRGFDQSGESREAAVLRVASESMGAREVVARDESPSKTRWFVALAGALALVLGITGFVLVRRGKRPEPLLQDSPSRPHAGQRPGPKVCPTCREDFPSEAEFCPNDGNRLVAQDELGVGPGGSVCPVCGRGFNPGTTSCPEHHEELIPAAAYAARVGVPAVTRAVCPLCGSQFGGEHRFCGECGAALVPIN